MGDLEPRKLPVFDQQIWTQQTRRGVKWSSGVTELWAMPTVTQNRPLRAAKLICMTATVIYRMWGHGMEKWHAANLIHLHGGSICDGVRPRSRNTGITVNPQTQDRRSNQAALLLWCKLNWLNEKPSNPLIYIKPKWWHLKMHAHLFPARPSDTIGGSFVIATFDPTAASKVAQHAWTWQEHAFATQRFRKQNPVTS